MIAGRETQNNGIMKMLALPVDRQTLSLAKFCVLVFYLFMEMVVFFVVFIVAGWLVRYELEYQIVAHTYFSKTKVFLITICFNLINNKPS